MVAWHPDRLHRSPRELEAFIQLLERTRCTVETVQAGHWDLSTPTGRMTARQIGEVGRYESEHRADRVRAGDGRAGRAWSLARATRHVRVRPTDEHGKAWRSSRRRT